MPDYRQRIAGIKINRAVAFLFLLIGLLTGLIGKSATVEAHAFLVQGISQESEPQRQKNDVQMYSNRPVTKNNNVEENCKLVDVATISHSNSNPWLFTLLDGKTMGTFLVDTGSSYTIITPSLAKKMDIVITPETPRTSITTVNGVVVAPVITVPKIAIGKVEVQNVQVLVQDLGPDIMLAGLLGMNFFKNMDLTIRPGDLTLCIHNE